MKPDFTILGSVMALGISPFIMSATESAITIVMNHGLQTYGGDLYVGSMTILQSVLQLIFVPVNGFTNGVQPIISYNFGAGQFDRVRQTIRRMIAITFTATFVYVVFAMLRPALFAGLFTTDPELIAIVAKVLPVYIAGMAIFGLQSGVQSSFLGLGQAKISLFIALLRKVILLIRLHSFCRISSALWAFTMRNRSQMSAPLSLPLRCFSAISGKFFRRKLSQR